MKLNTHKIYCYSSPQNDFFYGFMYNVMVKKKILECRGIYDQKSILQTFKKKIFLICLQKLLRSFCITRGVNNFPECIDYFSYRQTKKS